MSMLNSKNFCWSFLRAWPLLDTRKYEDFDSFQVPFSVESKGTNQVGCS